MSPASPVIEHETEVVIAAVETVADDVVLLTLTAVDGSPLPAWAAGAHIDLMLEDGVERQYSLCGSPDERGHYRVAVLREPNGRGGSEAVHRLGEGDRMRIRGPRNHFALAGSKRYIFVAGGIGITPIIPMIEQAEAAGAEWELHYGGRTTSSMAFRDLLAKHGDRVTLVPQDEHGLLDLKTILGKPEAGTLVYCCGPEPLLQAVEAACEAWPPRALHVERFTPKEVDESGDTAFELVLEASGKTLVVEPGVSALEAMRAAGLNVLSSCKEGTCGTCEQIVLEGEVDHRDSVLSPAEQAENDCMMVCVSRAKSARIVIDA